MKKQSLTLEEQHSNSGVPAGETIRQAVTVWLTKELNAPHK